MTIKNEEGALVEADRFVETAFQLYARASFYVASEEMHNRAMWYKAEVLRLVKAGSALEALDAELRAAWESGTLPAEAVSADTLRAVSEALATKDCARCAHKADNADGGHCYMFEAEPEGDRCGQMAAAADAIIAPLSDTLDGFRETPCGVCGATGDTLPCIVCSKPLCDGCGEGVIWCKEHPPAVTASPA